MNTIKTYKPPIDAAERKRAVSGQKRNTVVTAGAGTGKTTLLVNRLLHMLLGHTTLQTEESPIRKIVAMTFTEKAAHDMKMRLLEELKRIVAVIDGTASEDEIKKGEAFLAHIRDEYQVTYSEIERRARKSLEDMDKALIGTIHSFAAYLLRLYPVESGVVPGFAVDEGDVFDELFEKEWTKWLEAELTLTSPHAHTWKVVLRRLDLELIRGLTRRLSGFAIPLHSLTSQMNDGEKDHSRYGSVTDPLYNEITQIIPCCEKPKNNLLFQLEELAKIFGTIKEQGIGYLKDIGYDLDKKPSEAKTGWAEGTFESARNLVKECHSVLKKLRSVDEEFIHTVINLILPFAKTFRQTYLFQGYISFDGLLTLTRDLLRNKEYRSIRDKLKSEIKVILVDEFQDTDPIQYEIVLFLSEALGHYSTDVRNIVLEPGKLFIVGDPKQSIYAFRRADIEAYELVVKQVCGEQGEILKLQENFRSHTGILDVINQFFDGRIMVEKPGLQPCYIPIHAHRPKTHPSQKVEVIFVSDPEGNELKADEAREAEAEWIARWVTERINNELMEDTSAERGTRKLAYRDVALLLRAFTQVRPYIEAFKRYSIPYIVEGEKHFYTTQEVLDFMNLLRTIENPYDTISFVGVLRSPIAGLTDSEIYELQQRDLLDYRRDISGEVNECPPNFIPIVKEFYSLLKKLHARAGILPISQLIAEIIDNTYVAEITASAWHGEQKLANLWKLYQMACDMEQSDGISLKAFIDRITTRIKEAREEGESPLSDEMLDVIKIMTIHKSKGLEFPVVILSNLHGEVRNDGEVLDGAVFDWSTSATGIVIGKGSQQVRNFQSIAIEKKLNDRSWEEEKRILYVAMTRAKERLILTGLWKNDDKSYMGLITQSLRDAGIEIDRASLEKNTHTLTSSKGAQEELPSPFAGKRAEGGLPSPGCNVQRISLGSAEMFVEHFKFVGIRRPSKTRKGKDWNIDWSSFAEMWKRRRCTMTEVQQTPLFISPTSLVREESIQRNIPSMTNAVQSQVSNAALIGSICHFVLKEWNFHETKEELRRSIESVIQQVFLRENKHPKIYLNPAFITSQDEYHAGISRSIHTVQTRDFEFIKLEVTKILSAFIDSEAYRELQDGEILGREVPFLLRWGGQIMRGVIDILYKHNNRLIIGEYKTDMIETTSNPIANTSSITDNSNQNTDTSGHPSRDHWYLERAVKYRHQKDIYTEAVKRCLNVEDPGFKYIFLRSGKAIAL